MGQFVSKLSRTMQNVSSGDHSRGPFFIAGPPTPSLLDIQVGNVYHEFLPIGPAKSNCRLLAALQTQPCQPLLICQQPGAQSWAREIGSSEEAASSPN